ncbi:polysialyltransferase family glycosyltransferase [Pectobacterium sp. B1J-3]|uniref:polysialyltransferase family glycosyltransferase n=1 Tax=Pectobacterium sp. B1J-3 TaxID=3385371 RepID=UPI0039059440
MKKKTLVGIKISSSYQLINFLALYDEVRFIYEKAIVYKYNYWGDDKIYKRYLDFAEKMGVEVKEATREKDIVNDLNVEGKSVFFNREFDFVYVNNISIVIKLSFPYSKSFIISDGLGMYGDIFTYIGAYKREKKVNDYSLCVFFAGINFLLKKMAGYLFKSSSFSLFDPLTLKINKRYIESIKKIFNESLSSLPKLKNGTMIFISQPLVQLGIISHGEYSSIINRLKKIANDEGLDFLIKLHPVELSGNEYISSDFFQFDGLIEEACVIDKNVKVVVSFLSTGSLNIEFLSDAKNYILPVSILNLRLSKKQKILISMIKEIDIGNEYKII